MNPSVSGCTRSGAPRQRATVPRLVLAMLEAIVLTSALCSQTAQAQGQARIAVSAFENKVKMPWWDASWKVGEGLAEMLTTELVKTGQFVVVERQAVADVVGEQALGQSGLVRRESAAPTGQMLGAQYVVRGAITQFQEDESGGNVGVQNRGTSVQANSSNAHIALDLRLIDTSTGQVVASHNISKSVPGGGFGIGRQTRSVAFGGDVFYQAPIGQVTRAAMQEAVQFIVARTPRLTGPRSYSLVKVEGSIAYVNAGANSNVRVGDVLQVYSRGEALTDPDTGLKLGTVERAIGLIQVTEVQDQFSVGTIQNATGVMKRGDSVRNR